MRTSRRTFLMGAAAAAAATFIPRRRARAAAPYQAKRVVVVAIGGGLRRSESLGMAEGATMPNLFGDIPLVSGFGSGPAGAARIAPEVDAVMPELVLPAPRGIPLFEQGTLVTNLRYAEGAPGHLQGQACLVSGAYNNIENRADAHAPAPTLFELHRRASNAPSTDAWYVSVLGGFYKALQSSVHPGYGPRYGGTMLSPPGLMSPLVPLVTSGRRGLEFTPGVQLPTVQTTPAEDDATARLTAILDGNTPAYGDTDTVFRATAAENAAVQAHIAEYYADPTYESYYPASVGIGVRGGDGSVDATNDSLTVFHTAKILEKFKPSVTFVTLLDIDAAHGDFNGYLRGQQVADAAISWLWDFIQSTDGLRDETALLVLPEHGRHLYMNGQNPDSYGRSGIDHGQGDDGDRDVWMLALGPDFKQGEVIAPTGIAQEGRASGRYETIDMTMSAATLLGHGENMAAELVADGVRPGLVIQEMMR